MDARSILLSKLDPFKEYIYLGVLLAAIIGSVMFIHHERVIGQQKLAADIAKNELKWQAKVDKVTHDAKTTIDGLNAKLAASLSVPPPNPIHVFMRGSSCGDTGSVRPHTSPGLGGDDASGSGNSVAQPGPESDIGPPTELILSDLKARIDYLQGYVRACQAAGVCEK